MNEAIPRASDAGVNPEVMAACALSTLPGLGAAGLTRLARAFGSFSGAVAARSRELLARASELKLRSDTVAYLSGGPELDELGRWAFGAARNAGARPVLLTDPDYPALLRETENPPPLLYVRGQLAPQTRRVAVVGSREADELGLDCARRFGEELATCGAQVVSGGARGVDSWAHAGALACGGTTVAVLGCGIDVLYPEENGELFTRIAAAGAIVTELPPGAQPVKSHFPRRNRIVSGLSSAVVVVQAAGRSGALLTAEHALRQGRRVFAVPGVAQDRLAEGPRKLLDQGSALPADSARAVLEALGWPAATATATTNPTATSTPNPTANPTPTATPTANPHHRLDDASARLLRILRPHIPLHVDDLARHAELTPQKALGKLSELELRGLCLQRPGKYFLRK